MPVNADFSADILSGLAPLPVNFTDHSTGPVASWNWSFGDGSFSDDQSPGHLYSLPGNYTVSLRVADMYGSQDTATRADFIRPGPPQFVIMTSANVTSGPANVQEKPPGPVVSRRYYDDTSPCPVPGPPWPFKSLCPAPLC